jgi:hypothetical protein
MQLDYYLVMDHSNRRLHAKHILMAENNRK